MASNPPTSFEWLWITYFNLLTTITKGHSCDSYAEAGNRKTIPFVEGSPPGSCTTPDAKSKTTSSAKKTWVAWAYSMCQKAFFYIMRRSSIASDAEPSLSTSPTSLATEPGAIGPAIRERRQPQNELPDELLMQILGYLNPSTLYLLRQTAHVFARPFGDKTFLQYHGPSRNTGGGVTFSLQSLTTAEEEDVAKLLRRDMYCRSCYRMRTSQSWDARLTELRQPCHCIGCAVPHPKFLFFPQDVMQKRESPVLRCVGRQGHVSLCHHKSAGTVTPWRDGISLLPQDPNDQRWCWHVSHCAVGEKGWRSIFAVPLIPIEWWQRTGANISAFPRMLWLRQGHKGGIAYGWDAPLLDIAQLNTPTLESVQKTLMESLDGALKGLSGCKHARRDGHLRQFVRSSICACLIQRGRHLEAFSKQPTHDCLCDRERYYNCPDCGGRFGWHLEAGRVTLMHRYIWNFSQPTSAAWLFLLDEDSYVKKLFTRGTKHILWCDDEQCAVSKRRRWESMVKANMVGVAPDQPWYCDHIFLKEGVEQKGNRLPANIQLSTLQ